MLPSPPHNRHYRVRNRLVGYDYSCSGWYFVTICVKNRKEYFGEIKNDIVVLNEFGEIVENQWLWLARRFDYVRLHDYIVMPNHFHGILEIDDRRRDRSRPDGDCRDRSRPDGDCRDRSRPDGDCRDRSRPVPTIAFKIKSLSELIGAFKTTSSKLIHQNGLWDFVWQRSFYDHIIRDEKSYGAICAYIQNNPINWAIDRNNPAKLLCLEKNKK